MKNKIISMILVAMTFFHGCYMDVGPDDKYSFDVSKNSSSEDQGTNEEVGKVIGDIFVKGFAGIIAFSIFAVLVAADFPVETAAAIAVGFFKKVALSFAILELPSIDANDPLVSVSYISEGAVAILGSEEIVLPEGKSKEETIALIINALYTELASGEFTLSASDQIAYFQNISAAAITGLEDARTDDFVMSCGVVATTSMSSLNDAAYSSVESVQTASEAIMSALSAKLSDVFSDDVTQLKQALHESTKGAINGLANTGLYDHTELSLFTKSLSSGTLRGLAQMNFSEDEVTEMGVSVSEGIAQGLLENDFTSSEIDTASTSINQGIQESMEELGFDAQSVETSGSQVDSAIEELKNRWGI